MGFNTLLNPIYVEYVENIFNILYQVGWLFLFAILVQFEGFSTFFLVFSSSFIFILYSLKGFCWLPYVALRRFQIPFVIGITKSAQIKLFALLMGCKFALLTHVISFTVGCARSEGREAATAGSACYY